MFLNMRRPGFTLPVQTKSTSSGFGPVSGDKNQEDIIFLRFSTKVENVKKRLSVETIYLLLFYFYWGRRFARSEKGATRDYYYSDYSFYVCQPWSFLAVAPIFACPQTGFHGAALVQNLGAPPGSPWVWGHSVWQAGPPKPLKAR